MIMFNKKALFSTMSHHPLHRPTLAAAAAAATSSAWFNTAGVGLVAVSILFAPPHEFDNLDCQSFCHRVVDGDEEPPHYYHH